MKEALIMEQMEIIATVETQMEEKKLFGVTQATQKILRRSYVIHLGI